MYEIMSILIFVLDIIVIVDCLRSSMSTNKKLLWIILILILPFLGMLLYFLLAKKKGRVI